MADMKYEMVYLIEYLKYNNHGHTRYVTQGELEQTLFDMMVDTRIQPGFKVTLVHKYYREEN